MLSSFTKFLSGDIIAKSFGLLSIPVFSRFISPQEFGIYTIVLSYAAIATILFSLNTHTSIGRFMYEKNVDYKGFISTTLILSGIIFLISSSFLLILNDAFVDELLGFEFLIYKNYFILFVMLAIIFNIYIQILIPQSKSKEYSILIITQAFSKFIFVLMFFYFIEASALRYLQSVLLADFLIILYISWNLKQYFKLKFNKIHIKYILNYSVYLIPYMLSAVILAQIDRIMIGSMVGEYEAGIYSVAYAFGSVPLIIFAAFSNAWNPKYYSNMNEKEYSTLDKDVLAVVLAIAIGISIYSTYIGYLLGYLLSDSYLLSLQHIPLISMAMFFAIMWNIWGRGIGYSKKTIWTSIAGIMSALANIYLNSILIPNFGLDGAVYATYLSYIFMAALGYIFAKYVLKTHTTSVSELKNIILCIFLISLYFYFIDMSSIIPLQVTLPIVLFVFYYVRSRYINNLVRRLIKI